jgi:NTE family protein
LANYLAGLDIKAPVRIPRSFATDPDNAYHIPCIGMSNDLQEMSDYESKIDRSRDNIERLIEEGDRSALRFRAERAAG